jgi:hypothetical protein
MKFKQNTPAYFFVKHQIYNKKVFCVDGKFNKL